MLNTSPSDIPKPQIKKKQERLAKLSVSHLKEEKKDMQYFIKTSDEGVAKELRESGYQELSKSDKFFVFINDTSKLKTFDKEKVIYTNNLCV